MMIEDEDNIIENDEIQQKQMEELQTQVKNLRLAYLKQKWKSERDKK